MITTVCDICKNTEIELRNQGIKINRFHRTREESSFLGLCKSEHMTHEFDICDHCLKVIQNSMKKEGVCDERD